MVLVSVSIVLYYFLIEFILRGSVLVSDAYELPELASNRARHLIPLFFIMDIE